MTEPCARADTAPGLAPALAARAAAGTRYDLAVPHDGRRALATGWLALGLAALAAAGSFSILLVLARTPYLQHAFPAADFFRVALVVHVNFSVLVWFVALAGALWSLNGTPRFLAAGWIALAAAAAGAAAMALAPFAGGGRPVMSNYVPVLDEPVFLAGLALFGAGFALLVLRALAAAQPVGTRPDGPAALRFGLNASAVACATALLALAWSYSALERAIAPQGYYEVLFWGAGHVVQFAYALLMLVAWLWLASVSGASVPLTPRIALLMFSIALASVFATPVIYLAFDVSSIYHRRLFTWLMEFGGGLAIVPVGAAVVAGIARGRAPAANERPLRAALAASLVLFGAGGAIGFLIAGSNVWIPAHYHGCIVGVTLALMGLVYLLLPRFGFAPPAARLATLQAYLYGLGQLLHIAGLLWSGGYGVQRKVAGAEQVLRTWGEIAGMGLMGLGGLLAVAGGLLFVVVVLRSVLGAARQGAHGKGERDG
jgi:hypothetical protein